MHPDPVRDRLWFNVLGNEGAPVNFAVLVLLGRQVMSGRTGNDTAIDVALLPAGVYVLVVKDRLGLASTRFVKQ